jgi:acetyltransferase-like isoleucine patch superfamily enzyme
MSKVNFSNLFNVIRYPFYIRKMIWMLYPYMLRKRGVQVGSKVAILGLPIVSMIGQSKIVIGDYCVLCSSSELTALGINHPIVIRTMNPNAIVTIGAHTGVSGGSICASSRIEIGAECLIGANVTIADTDFHSISPGNRRYNNSDIVSIPIHIEDNVFIGANSTILKGVRIGRNSVIGASSVVTCDIPENCVAAGNPAKIIRKL